MKLESLNQSKLLGFDLEGNALFDLVVPTQSELSLSRAAEDSKIVGISKADGVAKALGSVKLAGNVKV